MIWAIDTKTKLLKIYINFSSEEHASFVLVWTSVIVATSERHTEMRNFPRYILDRVEEAVETITPSMIIQTVEGNITNGEEFRK